ncbi:uridine-cytidine kinase-like protein 2 [Globomyces pollinis-pini]|nr:uridine-cytidine kinase-like protein 2 [Globomyces pollinis-pini]
MSLKSKVSNFSFRPQMELLSINPENPTPFMIAMAGGSASGKKKCCDLIINGLSKGTDPSKVIHIQMENFYKELTADEHLLAEQSLYNFDHPEAFDFDLLESCLLKIRKGIPTTIPQYDFINRKRLSETITINRPDIVIISGILILYVKQIRDLMDLKAFVDVDGDTRLSRLLIRDTKTRNNKPADKVLTEYIKFVKPSFEEFILPSKKFADVIIPRGEENTIAIDLIAEHINDILKEKEEFLKNLNAKVIEK